MKRINIVYGGQPYSVGGRELESVLAEIGDGMLSAQPRWLVVNYGEGVPRTAHLLLSAGIDIAVIPVPGVDEDPAEVSAEPSPPPAR